jgi:hypothetical protein
MNANKTVTMRLDSGSTRALACSDRRPRRSKEIAVLSPNNGMRRFTAVELELGSTRALACSDRRPRRSVEDVVASQNGRWFKHFDVVGGAPTTAREGACAPQSISPNNHE